MTQYITTALAVIALLIIGIFAIQNLAIVEVSFLFWSASVSKIIVILGTYVLGMLTGGGLLYLIKGYINAA
jgi:putative membrane protein